MKDAESAYQSLYVIMRCNRWGIWVRWRANPRGVTHPAPKRVVSWWFKLVMLGKVQQHQDPTRGACDVDIIEAEQTQRCVFALPDHLRDTIVEEYAVGGTADQKAAALGIDASTFRRRRCQAHVELLGLFNDIECGVPIVKREPTRAARPPIPRPAAA